MVFIRAIAIARLNKGVLRFAGPVFGYVTAIALHGFHNLLASIGLPLLCFVGSALDWIGFLSMFAFILYLIWRQGKIMRKELSEEVQRGNLTSLQYDTAVSVIGQMGARWGPWPGAAGAMPRASTTCWARWPSKSTNWRDWDPSRNGRQRRALRSCGARSQG